MKFLLVHKKRRAVWKTKSAQKSAPAISIVCCTSFIDHQSAAISLGNGSDSNCRPHWFVFVCVNRSSESVELFRNSKSFEWFVKAQVKMALQRHSTWISFSPVFVGKLKAFSENNKPAKKVNSECSPLDESLPKLAPEILLNLSAARFRRECWSFVESEA